MELFGKKLPNLGSSPANGFTLVELMVVVGVIAVLSAMLSPLISRARGSAYGAQCASNLRQLCLANELYAGEHGTFVAAAEDIRSGSNAARWHGGRSSPGEPFDSANGPLAPYLGPGERIRACPAMQGFSADGFEAGCGGYGYNYYGVGSRSYIEGAETEAGQGMEPAAIANPAATVMFTDAAFLRSENGKLVLIEYSFAEPYRHLADNAPTETYTASPSIHFRHNGKAGVGWCDGHVTYERMTFSKKSGGYQSMNIGWFGEKNNELFDPF